MRRLFKGRLAGAVLMMVVGVAAGMAPRPAPAVELPPPSMEARAYLPGLTREEVHAAWGEPKPGPPGFFGDIYEVNETAHIIVHYDIELINAGAADQNTVPVLYTVYGEA